MNRLVLEESLDVLLDHRGKTPKKLGSDFTATGVPVASAIMVDNGVLNLSEARFVSHQTWKSWMPVATQSGDVLLTSEAPLGRVARVPSDAPLVLGQRLFALRGKSGVLDSGFLFYALQTERVQADLLGRSTGTTVFGIRQSALRRVLIPAPPYEQQRAIAEVLGALDDKIAANERTSLTVRCLCRAEFLAALNQGTSLVPLDDIALFHNRRRVPLSANQRASRPGDVPYYGATGRIDCVDEALFDEPLVLVGEDGSVVTDTGAPVVQYIWGPSWVNNHAHVLTAKVASTELLQFALERTTVLPLVTGAVQPKLSMGNLRRLLVEMPRPSVLTTLDEETSALVAVLRAKFEETATLARMRDTLLPLLMSGKIRVEQAEEVVQGVV